MLTVSKARGSRITQRGLAAKVGVDSGHLSRIERGERSLTPTLALKIARVVAPPAEVTATKNALLEGHKELRRQYLLGVIADAKAAVVEAAGKGILPAFGTSERSGSPVGDASPESDEIAGLNLLLDAHGFRVAEDGNGVLIFVSSTTGEKIGESFTDVVQAMAGKSAAKERDRDSLVGSDRPRRSSGPRRVTRRTRSRTTASATREASVSTVRRAIPAGTSAPLADRLRSRKEEVEDGRHVDESTGIDDRQVRAGRPGGAGALRIARAEVDRLKSDAEEALAAVERAKEQATSVGDLDAIEAAEATARRAALAVELAEKAAREARRQLDEEVAQERAVTLARAEARRDALLATIRELAGKLADAGEELETLARETKRAGEWTDERSGVRHRVTGFLQGVPLRQIEALDEWRIGYVRPRQW